MSDESEFNPKGRRLCPDGSCVGVIGSDGRCGECGKVAGPGGAFAEAAGSVEVEADATAETTTTSAEGEHLIEAAPSAGADEGFDPKRRLCDDGSCVGIIGAGGVCNVCGKRGTASGL